MRHGARRTDGCAAPPAEREEANRTMKSARLEPRRSSRHSRASLGHHLRVLLRGNAMRKALIAEDGNT